MTRKSNKNLLSLILSMMLIVAMAFSMTGCGGDNTEKPNTENQADTGALGDAQDENDVQADADTQADMNTQVEITVVGEGSTVFTFTVVDADGKEQVYEVHTDETMVGDALLELELISGDMAEYGLYVKTVGGITVDYDTDGKYWAFYVNGEYAMTGVDATPITEGEEYAFKVE